jgi:sugar/nucleoside kinase (ribokinase family)
VTLDMNAGFRTLRLDADAPFRRVVGVGGIGTGIFLALEGDHLLGRNESRPARLLEVRDYCKLHIVGHYLAVLLGADPSGSPFHVVPVGRVGDDDAGSRLLDEMTAVGVDTSYVKRTRGRPTLFSVCFQYPDGSGGNLTTVDSAAAAIDDRDVDGALPLLSSAGAHAIALALPEVPLEARRHLLELATAHGAFRTAAFATSEIAEARVSGLLDLVDLLSVNEEEAAALMGRPLDPEDPAPSLERCIGAVGAQSRDLRLLVSAGRHGVFASAGGRWDHCPTLSVPVASTAGAGDALLAGVLSALAAGVPFIEPGPGRSTMQDGPLSSALDLGVLLAAFSVTSPHTIHPDANLPSLLAFADEMGISFSGALRRAVEAPAG